MPNLIDVQNLSIQFATPAGPIHALRNLSFRVRSKSSVALVGESGSGKSVSAQAITGLLPRSAQITSGKILFRDPKKDSEIDLAKLDVRGTEFRRIRGGRISMIFQEPMTSLSPLHTIGDQVGEVARIHEKLTAAQADARTLEMLKLVRFPNPERALKSYPFELSGGLRQRAMIAMALICGPALLIADEPTTALDVTVQAQILALIRDIQHELDMSVLMITHDMGVVANVAEEVVVMFRGEVMESGTAQDIFADPRHPYLHALLDAVPRIDSDPAERLKPLVEDKSAKSAPLVPLRPRESRKRGEPLLTVDRVVKRYSIRSDEFSFSRKPPVTVTAVDHVSFEVKRGECLGLVGESGCGKTTIAKMIMSAITADEGRILFDEGGNTVDLARLDESDLKPFRRRIQYIFQDPFGSLNPRMTVGDLLTEPLAVHGIGDAASRRERAAELMRRVGIDPRFLNRYPHSFSGGQRQRIGIGRALILEPELVLCDEPVSALDVSTRAQVLNLLKDLQAELGLTLLFISHDLAVVNYIADRVAVMCRGKLVELAPREQLFRSPQHPYTRALLSSVPHPDLHHPLDFAAIGRGLMTEPAHWPAPFAADSGNEPKLIDLGSGHLVRALERPTPALVS
ncbi:MAG: ABC transporter ATP-binding protein [Hyphomicrobiaceae bacterium]